MYQLPTNPSIPCTDPLGILDVETPSQAEVLSTLIETAMERLTRDGPIEDILPTLVEDIAYSIHGNGSLDTGGLREFLTGRDQFLGALLVLLHAAKALPNLFPNHRIPALNRENKNVTLTAAQINSILAHQFLGTLNRAEGTNWGLPVFTSWFASEPAHHKAVEGYLDTILDHFAHRGYDSIEKFAFHFFTADGMPDPSQCHTAANIQLKVVSEESEPSELSKIGNLQHPFVLVAAHSQPGPGATATQEERLQSTSPALSVSALLIPVIPDDAVVVTSAFPVHAAWRGHNRTARTNGLFDPEQRPRRHYILADALQIDELEDEQEMLKDLSHGRPEREVKKLYAAFSGASCLAEENMYKTMCTIEAGAWGCGAFGGNILVKSMCMAVAAGLAQVAVQYSLLAHRSNDITLVESLLKQGWSTAKIWERVVNSKANSELLFNLRNA